MIGQGRARIEAKFIEKRIIELILFWFRYKLSKIVVLWNAGDPIRMR